MKFRRVGFLLSLNEGAWKALSLPSTVPLSGFIGLYFLALWISHPSDKPNLWFALSSLFIQLVILYISINTVAAIVRGNKEALPILFGVILGVALGTHDVVYSLMGKRSGPSGGGKSP